MPTQDEKKKYIQSKLNGVAHNNHARILLAIESGSRAWGFPSADSDYDVRFIYVRKMRDYLAVEPVRDVIETDLSNDAFLGAPLDLNGWDLRKALQLGLKSNAVLVEWLVSPIIYAADNAAVDKLLRFAASTTDLRAFEYHYAQLGRHVWSEISQSSGPIKIKKYFYALRPALALAWIRRFEKTPPMNILQIMKQIDLAPDLLRSIQVLIDDKAKATESDLTERKPLIDDFLTQHLDGKHPEKKERAAPAHAQVKKADDLFFELIQQA